MPRPRRARTRRTRKRSPPEAANFWKRFEDGMQIMTRTLTRRKSEEGAILIQVAISIFVLMCFLVFVFDYGIVWASRAQAQNSADAGALAGAIARGYDDFTNP